MISARDEFAVTDAGIKELAREEFPPRIASGAHPDSLYELVGDDMGRVTVPAGERLPQVGDALECITPHCYQTLTHYDVVSLRARRHAGGHLAHRRPLPVVRRGPNRLAPF